MKKFYFTFGVGHANNDRYQVVFAKSKEEARIKMFELHGRQWAFPYTQEQWEASKASGYFSDLKPLDNAYTFEFAS